MTDNEKHLPEIEPDGTIEREPEFYYSRERRLGRASAEVRALNDGVPVRPGLRNTFFAAKGNVMVFLSIIAICAMFGMVSRLSARGDSGLKLGGNTVNITITREEGALILGVNKTAPETGEVYTGDVDIAVSPVVPREKDGEGTGDLPPMFAHSVVFNPVNTEAFYVSLPFEGDDFFVIVRTGDEQKTMRLGVK